MFVTNDDVWKTIVCSLVIWFSGGACEITDTPLTLTIVIDAVLLDIVVTCWVCAETFCVNTTADNVGPLVIGLHNPLIGAIVIVEPSCCGVLPVTGVKMGAIIGSNDIIGLMGLVDVLPAPPVSPDAIFRC
ncbi:unnamed protein product [Lactuca virosa]|uniref:Uncharacterized protein n=1 Tax=Lactuca virosa TaxID=75947 RepID=A0AAU9MF70_9ASTR|nr:unnamed protein product [Lactuca virosa]